MSQKDGSHQKIRKKAMVLTKKYFFIFYSTYIRYYGTREKFYRIIS